MTSGRGVMLATLNSVLSGFLIGFPLGKRCRWSDQRRDHDTPSGVIRRSETLRVHRSFRQRDSNETQNDVYSHRGGGDSRPMATIDVVRRYEEETRLYLGGQLS